MKTTEGRLVMFGRTLLVTLVALLAAAPAAQAVIDVRVSGSAVIVSGTSLANTVFLDPSQSPFAGRIRVLSTTDDIAAGSGCVVETARRVHCTDQPILRTDLLGGPDLLDVSHSIRCDICFLGSGDDRFVSTDASQNDVINGETGADNLNAGGGTQDTVLYTERLNDMLIDLRGSATSGDKESSADGSGTSKDALLGFERAYGGGGNDEFVGNGSPNRFQGGAGSDTFTGGSATDISVDTVSYLPDFYDTTHVNRGIRAEIGGGPVSGQAIDRISGPGDDIGADIENVHGGNNGDTLIGDGDPNTLVGNGGDDFLEGRAGRDTIAGNLGSDTVSYADRKEERTEPVSIFISEGEAGGASDGPVGSRDTFLNDVENFLGGSGNDTLTGNGNANILDGGPGRDAMDGNGGLDTVSYASRNEAVSVNLVTSSAVQGGPLDGAVNARDTIADIENATGGGGNDTIVGRSANVRLGISGVNVLRGGLGDDVLDGAGASDDLFGDGGSDTVSYASRTTAVTATASGSTGTPVNGNEIDGAAGARDRYAGIENLRGGSAGDTLGGDGSGNRLEGNGGNDTLTGGFGGDTLIGGFGADNLVGGGGTGDTASYEDRTASVAAVLGTNDINGNADDGAPGSRDDIAADVENLAGGSAGDSLTGNNDNNTLFGNGGNDVLAALGGSDRLEGGDQDDTLHSGLGNDTVIGNGGADTASYSERTAAVFAQVATSSGNGQVGTGESDNLATDVEHLAGGSAGDSLIGSSGANTLTGNGGEDVMDGGFGADTIAGNAGTDTITYEARTTAVSVRVAVAGASGNANDGAAGARDTVNSDVEVVRGTGQNDTLEGTAGSQTLAGLGGDDTLVADFGADTADGGAGANDVVDYGARIDPVTVRLETNGASGNADDGPAGSRDSITGVENARGGIGDDLLVGSAVANRLEGNSGIDRLQGEHGPDRLIGGDGPLDVASYAERTVPVTVRMNTDGQSGNADDGPAGSRDFIDLTTEAALGGSGEDELFGSASPAMPERLDGGGGDDLLDGRGGPDDLRGGDGVDTASYATRTAGVFVSLTNTPTSGNAEDGPSGGRDTLLDIENAEGGSGGDELLGFSGPNGLNGNDGPDKLDGGFGPDTLVGGDGADTASYESRGTAVLVRIGIAGHSGNADDGPAGARDDVRPDVEGALGGSAADQLRGTANRDTLIGGGGNDRLFGLGGADTLIGGEGTADHVSYSDRTTPVRVEIGGGAVSGNEVDDTSGQRDRVDSSVERVTGGRGNDELIGNGLANRLEGGAGDDLLQGLAGSDILLGGSGTGDVASYAERTTPTLVRLGAGRVSGDDTDGPPNARDDVRRDVEGVAGGSAADELHGTSGPNTLLGGPGPDILVGLAGDDTLLGEGDDDSLDGGDDADALRGGDGDETASYADRTTAVRATLNGTATSGNGADGAAGARDAIDADVENLTGGAGNDVLIGSDGRNRLDGRDGGDTLSGEGGPDTLLGGRDPDRLRGLAGDDVLDGGGDADDLRGGDDRDLVTYDSRASAVDVRMGVAGASGNADDGPAGSRDSIISDVEDLVGTSDDDTLAGGANNNTIDGGEGADVIRGLGGLDTITYDGRPDPVTVNLGVVRGSGNDVDGPPGNRDSVEVDVERVVGTAQNDILTGSTADNVLEGGFGADQMAGLGGTDTVTYEQRTTAVNARIGGTGGNADDGAGDTIAIDVEDLVGGSGNDTLTGDDGTDSDPPDAGANTLRGEAGDDTLAGGEDPDRFIGGAGTDTVTYAAANGNVTARIGVVGGSGSPSDGAAGARDTILADVENLIGSQQADDLTGSGVPNRIQGLDGNDALSGLGDSDVLEGGAEVDVMDGGTGPDTMDGGTSAAGSGEADTVTYARRRADVVATIGGGPVSGDAGDGTAGARDTIQSNVERLVGGSGNDVLTGINTENRLTGNAGADTLVGAGQRDTLLGGAGDDTLEGEAGADDLDGGVDGDTLRGGTENDELAGGEGDDTLEGSAGDDRLFGGDDDDTLRGDAGLDSLFGEDGNDSLDGGVDRDISSGGTGSDTATYLVRTARVVVVIGEEFVSGDATDEVGGQRDTINTDVEHLTGGEGDDALTGNADRNRLIGSRGNDDIFGGTGNDTLIGGPGDDELDGQADDDTIRGDAGLDTLFGGFGADTLFGGLDNDDLRIRGDATRDTAQCDEGDADSVIADAIDTVDATTCETVLLP